MGVETSGDDGEFDVITGVLMHTYINNLQNISPVPL